MSLIQEIERRIMTDEPVTNEELKAWVLDMMDYIKASEAAWNTTAWKMTHTNALQYWVPLMEARKKLGL